MLASTPLSLRSARLVLALAATLLCLTAAEAGAATFTVDSGAADAVDSNPGDGQCSTGTACTLRAAVQEANTTPADDTIVLPSGGVANLTLGAAGNALASSGDLDVTNDLIVTASGAAPATIDGGDVDRIFDVADNAPNPNFILALVDVTLRNGRVQADDGGAVRTAGTLEMTTSRITSSDAVRFGGGDGLGGAIATAGTQSIVAIDRSRLDGNTASVGGAIANQGETTIDESTLDGNSSRPGESGSGGAVRNLGVLEVANSTLTGNTDNGGNGGGAIINQGDTTVRFSTIADNASALGSAVRNIPNASLFKVSASIVLGTCHTNAVLSVAPHHNIGGGASCGLNHATDDPAGTATLGALGDNGGPTPTRALSGNGVDEIPAAQCATPTVDQRGGKRPFGGGCDVGAYETASLADLQLTGAVSPPSAVVGGNVTYSYDVAVSGPDPATNVVLTDELPAGTSFVSASAGCTGPGVGSGGTVTCALGSVSSGSPEAVSIVVKANSANPSLSNTASLDLDQNDLTPAELTLTSAVTPPPCGTPGGGNCPTPPPPPPCGTPGAAACPPPPLCGTPGAAACPPPLVPLKLTDLKASPAKFRAAAGTRLSFTLTRDAKVTLAFKGPITRRRVCTKKAGKRRCRTVTKSKAAGSFTADGKAGANQVRFNGKVGGKALKPGRYTIAPTATTGAETIKARTMTVTVLKPKR